MRPLLRAFARTRLGRLLAPAWFDEARLIVQEPALRRLLGGRTFGGRLLNAGCGEGLYAEFVESAPDVTLIVNIDAAPPSIAVRRSDPRHRDAQGSLDALPFASHTFDTVLCTEVLEHITDDGAAIAELARVLREGGVIVISVPALAAPADPAHVREGYAPDHLRALCESNGIAVIASVQCLHAIMRATYRLWQWQHRVAGRNVFPRALLRGAAGIDRATKWGRPWDLVVAGVRRAD